MFGWFLRKREPRPPLDPIALGWINDQLGWLRDEFGAERLIDQPIVEPTDAFFPDPYDGSPLAAERMFGRVCAMMEVAPEIVDLQFYGETRRPGLVNTAGHLLPGSAGTYSEGDEHFIIRLNRDELARPMDLVGTMAYELSHLRLLGENRSDPYAFDNELLTDLTAIYYGFGVLLANSPRAWPSQVGFWPGTKVRRPEYMSLPMITYALAVIADLRFEERPAWAKHFRSAAGAEWADAREYLRLKDGAR